MPAAQVAELKEQKYAEGLDRLLDLRDARFVLEVLKEEIEVDGRPAVGIKVSSEGHRDVELYFDHSTWLLLKRKQTVLDQLDMEVSQEVTEVTEPQYSDRSSSPVGRHSLEVEEAGVMTTREDVRPQVAAETASPLMTTPRPSSLTATSLVEARVMRTCSAEPTGPETIFPGTTTLSFQDHRGR